MRNPDRIPVVLAALQEEWEEHPDLRLGQLLWKLAGESDVLSGDPYHLEDDALLDVLDADFDGEYYTEPLNDAWEGVDRSNSKE